MNYISEVSLFNEDGTQNVIIEICPGTSDKNELIEPNFQKLECVRQVCGIYPFYYGSFPQTHAGDNDPLDFIMFTDKSHNLLDVVKVDVIGAIRTVDAGEQDDKIICVESDCNLYNLKKPLKEAFKFLKKYKGTTSQMVIDKKLASMNDAMSLVEVAHQNWKDLTKKRNSARVIRRNNSNDSRIRVIRR